MPSKFPKVPGAIYLDPDVTDDQLRVYGAMKMMMKQRDKTLRTSRELISKKSGKSVSSIHRSISGLLRSGWISVGKSKGCVSEYALHESKQPVSNLTHVKSELGADVEQVQTDLLEQGQGGGNGTKEPPTRATWQAYSAAYEQRYTVKPLWSARVGGDLRNFLNEVPREDAPHVAAYFVTSNYRWYVTKGHSTSCLVTDARKLWMEWKTQRQATESQAREGDRIQNIAGQAQRVLARRQQRRQRE